MISLWMRVALLAARLRDLRLAMRVIARMYTAGVSWSLLTGWTSSRSLSMTSSGEGGRSGMEAMKRALGQGGPGLSGPR